LFLWISRLLGPRDARAAACEHVEVNASPSPVLLFDLSGNGADRGGG